ncbi:MAG: hypothetical protein A3J63_04920 [Candidatus Moranbacteria bacterium RIFCSPHIGHO2_02_FULL_40_12b]|nr:MAG: hypothetical protein A3J63_04920 [Candidatus Moranbacteria bacterium RIFCSPHIGHO2_02_FULL_40_12b]OGI23577.1 MAG: hypothetical protein A3E91_02840 [Candidatus Moranbacteria bacterium RIFCSPHIGHO2_12_FULL_40_10]
MPISKKITDYLNKNKYKYEIIEHRTTYTAWDTAQTEKVKPQEVAKALVMKADNDYLVALVPSNKNLDKKGLLKVINVWKKKSGGKACKKIDFAKEAWMKKNLPGKVGATPPFAGLINLGVYIDNALKKNKKIYLGSGEYTESVRVSVSQYLKIEKPVMGNFSVKKN